MDYLFRSAPRKCHSLLHLTTFTDLLNTLFTITALSARTAPQSEAITKDGNTILQKGIHAQNKR